MRLSLALARPVRRTAAGALVLAAASATALGVSAVSTGASAGTNNCGACPGRLFITSAVEHPDGTVTLPLHKGISNGQAVYYVVTDASDGSVASGQQLSRTIAPVSVSFFGWQAEVLYAGSAPGFVAGTVQINARIPEQMGSFAYPVDLVLSSGVTYAPVGVTVNIQ